MILRRSLQRPARSPRKPWQGAVDSNEIVSCKPPNLCRTRAFFSAGVFSEDARETENLPSSFLPLGGCWFPTGGVARARCGSSVGLGPMPPLIHCLVCGERIRVYEPIVVVEHKVGAWETSLERDPGLVERSRALLMHARCAPDPERALSPTGDGRPR